MYVVVSSLHPSSSERSGRWMQAEAVCGGVAGGRTGRLAAADAQAERCGWPVRRHAAADQNARALNSSASAAQRCHLWLLRFRHSYCDTVRANAMQPAGMAQNMLDCTALKFCCVALGLPTVQPAQIDATGMHCAESEMWRQLHMQYASKYGLHPACLQTLLQLQRRHSLVKMRQSIPPKHSW